MLRLWLSTCNEHGGGYSNEDVLYGRKGREERTEDKYSI